MAYDNTADFVASAYGYGNSDIKFGVNNGDFLTDAMYPKKAEFRDYIRQLGLQHDAQSFNAMEAEKQRQWETMMSNSAVQRNVADIKAAGLNPWLAIQGSGSIGASTPAGASASSAAGHSTRSSSNGAVQIISSALNLVGKALMKIK